MSNLAERLPRRSVTRLGRYALRYKIAEGGMAAVYLGQTGGAHGFESWVAIKMIHEHLAHDPRFVAMFLDEVRVTGMIRHPNVCSVLDFGEHDGQAYLVMEYLHGESASAMLRRATEGLPSWLAARVVCDAARGLAAAHALTDATGEPMGVVHRDVSPQNIVVLYDGHTKVVDFGIARAKGRLTDTRTGETKGKLAYMAPEQVRGRAVDQRTDVWALGVVLWELLTRRRLFRGENEADTIYRVLQQDIPPPSRLQPGVPKALDRVTRSALLRNPAARLSSASELADLLEAHLYSMGKPAGASRVAHWMRDHFADKRASREAMLRAKALPLGDVVEVEIESNSSVGALRRPNRIADPTPASPHEDAAAVARAGSAWRSRAVQIGAGLAGVLLIAGAVAFGAFVFGDSDQEVPRRARDPVANAVGGAATRGVSMKRVAPQTMPRPTTVQANVGRRPPPASASTEAAGTPMTLVRVRPTRAQDAVPAGQEVEAASTMAGHRAAGRGMAASSRRPQARRRSTRTRHSPRAPVAETGRLNLVCIPRARVFARGRLIGTTPLSGVSLPAGRQSLFLRAENGGGERRISVEIRPGQVAQHPLVRLSPAATP